MEFRSNCAAIGLECWHDENCIRAGDDFAVEITRAIRACVVFVLMLSPASNSSDYVHKEVAIAHHFQRPIIPVLIADTDLSDEMLPYLVRCHRWDMRTKSAHDLAVHLRTRFDPSVGRKDGTTSDNRGSGPPEAPASPSEKIPLHFVTNDEYLTFVRASGREMPGDWNSPHPRFTADQARNPVLGMSWSDALAYCDWAGGCLPASSGSPTAERAGLMPDSQGVSEWRDGGDRRRKHICDAHTSKVVAVMDREARPLNVGFRCIPVEPANPMDWVDIPAGTCCVGADIQVFTQLAAAYRVPADTTRPMLNSRFQERSLHKFSMAARCVTNEEYYAFTRATGRPWPPHWGTTWLTSFQQPFPVRLASRPVVNVSAHQAQAYCIWSRTRLPSWVEWQRAAAGHAARPYPWGEAYGAERCNSVESARGSLARADDCPFGDTPEGIRQLCGNVAEWVIGPGGQFELRGGSYRLPCEFWGLAYAFRQVEHSFRSPDTGFRVVLD